MMNKNSNNIVVYIATIILMFALCTPITSLMIGVLFLSQNFNSLIAVILGILIGGMLYYYIPIIYSHFNNMLDILKG